MNALHHTVNLLIMVVLLTFIGLNLFVLGKYLLSSLDFV